MDIQKIDDTDTGDFGPWGGRMRGEGEAHLIVLGKNQAYVFKDLSQVRKSEVSVSLTGMTSAGTESIRWGENDFSKDGGQEMLLRLLQVALLCPERTFVLTPDNMPNIEHEALLTEMMSKALKVMMGAPDGGKARPRPKSF